MAFARGSQMSGFGGYVGTTGTKGPIDVADLRRSHNAFLAAHDRVLESALGDIAEAAVLHARRTNLVKFRTGTMAHGWQRTPVQLTSLGLVVSLYSNVPHAFYQEFGTGLWGPTHDYIRPKRAKFLRWTSNGQVHFARKVKGVPPKFIGKTSWFQAGAFEGPKILERAVGRLASRF